MRKFNKRLASLLLGAAVALTAVIFPAFAADSSVTYEGGAEKFVFVPGSGYTDTDLFDNFKGVMPGDSVSEKITVKNNYRGCDYVRVYMRAEAHDETENPMSPNAAVEEKDAASMNDFLSQLSMKVYIGDKLIYDASPDELGSFAENVLLGSFGYGAGAELDIRLEVPIELGNEYADRVGEVDWVFTVEQRNYSGGGDGGDDGNDPRPGRESEPGPGIIITPDEVPLASGPMGVDEITGVLDASDTPFGVLPATGDNTTIWPYILLLAVGILGLTVTVFKKGKKEDTQ